jgi:subtilisin family serine protease
MIPCGISRSNAVIVNVSDGINSLGSQVQTAALLGKGSDTIFVKPKKHITHASLAAHHQKIGATVKRTFSRFGNLQVVKLPPGLTVEQAIKHYQASGLVEYAEPDYQVHAVLSPNDPRYLDGSLWNLNNTGQNGGTPYADISAPAGWSLRTSADPIIVAVIDTGVWYSHEDLASNMWVNPCVGCPVDGVVYPNDVYGINAITGTGDPLDDMFHGTHCAGIIGAVGNNGIGGVGVAWNVRIMACKFLDANGSGYTSDAIECVNYAVSKGAKVLSCSWGGSSYSQALHDAIAAARDEGVILVAAAGNSAANNDTSSFYPANYDSDLDNVVAVAATDRNDQLASFSDYGAASVALGAPGVSIYSTLPGIETVAMQSYGLTTNYGTASGTSMACPHVAGVMAMVYAQYPTNSHLQIIQRVLGNTDPVSSLSGRTLTGGRLNLFNALAQPPQPPFWLTYQWRMNGTNIPGQTGSSCSFGPVTINDNGDLFDVVVSNQCGTVISTAALLTVDTPCLITEQPTNMTQQAGDNALFSVSASGSTPLNYRWRKIGGGWGSPWVLTENGPGSGSLIIGSSTNNGDHSYNPSYPTDADIGGKAFGINASGGHTMQVARSLNEPLPPGGVFTISMDSGYVGANGAAGIAMYSVSNQLWFEFFCTNNTYYYSATGVTPAPATWIPFTSHPINFSFDMFPDGLLFIVANDPSGAGTLFVDYIPALANDPPDHFVLYNNNAGNGPANDVYFNGLGLYERYDLGDLVGYDDATEAAYTNGWQSGDDGGTGPIPGATNSVYVIPSCAPTDSGTYNVIVDNPCNFLVSSDAGLTVLSWPWPIIVAQPTNQTVAVGGTATFNVTATGSPPLSYQWSFNGTNIDGGTNTSLTLTNVQLSQAGNYAVLVTNLSGSILSSNAVLTVGQPSSCAPVPSGLVSWWPGEGNANDVAGTNNGTLVNGAGFATGEAGQAFSLSGSNYVSVPDAPALNPTNAMTIECWLYRQAVIGSFNPVVKKSGTTGGGTANGYSLEFDVNNILFWIYSSNGGWRSSGDTVPIQLGRWYHIAGVYDGAHLLVYTNGQLAASASASGSIIPSVNTLRIGSDPTDPSRGFKGSVDEVSIYNRALSSNEIAAIYAAGSGGKCPLTAPTIISQPTNQTVTVGGTATFSVTASGTPPLSYQWNFNGTNIVVATNTSLILTNVQLSQAGNYAVLVTNLYGSILGSNAVLTVNPLPLGVPVIARFSPISGSIGTSVTIFGTNFSPVASNNIVYFGAVRATVVAASVTNLAVTVPVGATYAPITETVNGLVAYANKAFEPTFLGDGSSISSSSFAARVDLVGGDGPIVTVIADLDGDGKPDLVVANYYGGNISLFRNISTDGSLTINSFAPRVDLPSFGGAPWGLAVADVDGDGKLDLVVSDSSNDRVLVYRNISTVGTLTANSFAAPVNFSVGTDPRAVRVGDLDGDGRPDIVCVNNGDNTLSILRNIGTAGSLTTNSFASQVALATGPEPHDLAIADLDGDGKPDLIQPNYVPSFFSVFRNTSVPGAINTNSFAARVDFATSGEGNSIIVGDVDGDGKPDVTVGLASGSAIAVYRNLASPGELDTNSFAAEVDFPAPGSVRGLGMGDLNGDGKPDISLVGEEGDFMSVYQNVSTPGSFTNTSLASRVDYSAGSDPQGVPIGDLDGDGRPDVVFVNFYDGTISIYQNEVPFRGALPMIVSQPTNQTVTVGGTATFNVTASGATPLSYQWNFNGTNIGGGTNTSLTLTNVQFSQAGNYAVLVTNRYGSILSSNAVLTVILDHFAWGSIPSPRFVNTPFSVVIRAQDMTNGLFTNFTGTAILGTTNGVAVTPPVSGNFIQGVWTGAVVVSQTASNLVLRADDGLGHFGLANPINVISLPTLGMLHSGNVALYMWPVGYSGFVLETSGSLLSATWVAVPYSPIQIGDQYLLPLDMTGTNGFYRLRFPGP